jgi:hypothetical protein
VDVVTSRRLFWLWQRIRPFFWGLLVITGRGLLIGRVRFATVQLD